MSRSKLSISPIRDELANLFGASMWCNLIGGTLLVLVWAAFTYIDAAILYMYYAAPLITSTTLAVMLGLGIVCIFGFVLDLATWARCISKKRVPKMLVLVSALLTIIIPPVGTFFGMIKLSIGRRMRAELDENEPLFDAEGIKQLLLFNALHAALVCVFLVLLIPAFYFIPLEFINDEDLFWLRLNIYNLQVVMIIICAGLVATIVVSALLAAKKKPAGRAWTIVACLLMLLAFPIGSYLAGVIYRNFLKKKEILASD
jgi:hypothetical protein